MKVGDLVKYKSRIVLLINEDLDFYYGIELGKTTTTKYLKCACTKLFREI